jgi:hypothetical protein
MLGGPIDAVNFGAPVINDRRRDVKFEFLINHDNKMSPLY